MYVLENRYENTLLTFGGVLVNYNKSKVFFAIFSKPRERLQTCFEGLLAAKTLNPSSLAINSHLQKPNILTKVTKMVVESSHVGNAAFFRDEEYIFFDTVSMSLRRITEIVYGMIWCYRKPTK